MKGLIIRGGEREIEIEIERARARARTRASEREREIRISDIGGGGCFLENDSSLFVNAYSISGKRLLLPRAI